MSSYLCSTLHFGEPRYDSHANTEQRSLSFCKGERKHLPYIHLIAPSITPITPIRRGKQLFVAGSFNQGKHPVPLRSRAITSIQGGLRESHAQKTAYRFHLHHLHRPAPLLERYEPDRSPRHPTSTLLPRSQPWRTELVLGCIQHECRHFYTACW